MFDFVLQHDPKLGMDVKARVNDAVNELNGALLGHNSPKLARDVEKTGLYIEYRKKYHEWEQACKSFEEKRTKARQDILQQSRDEWARISAEKIEAINWDWCPIWWVLKRQPKLREDMPPQLWKHNGKSSQTGYNFLTFSE